MLGPLFRSKHYRRCPGLSVAPTSTRTQSHCRSRDGGGAPGIEEVGSNRMEEEREGVGMRGEIEEWQDERRGGGGGREKQARWRAAC